jgi:hypothetical protein
MRAGFFVEGGGDDTHRSRTRTGVGGTDDRSIAVVDVEVRK